MNGVLLTLVLGAGIVEGRDKLGGIAMPPTVQSLGIDMLSREERIALVQAIWDTIAAEAQPPLLTEAQRRELERRVADDDANPNDVVPWEQVKAETLARLKPSSHGQAAKIKTCIPNASSPNKLPAAGSM